MQQFSASVMSVAATTSAPIANQIDDAKQPGHHHHHHLSSSVNYHMNHSIYTKRFKFDQFEHLKQQQQQAYQYGSVHVGSSKGVKNELLSPTGSLNSQSSDNECQTSETANVKRPIQQFYASTKMLLPNKRSQLNKYYEETGQLGATSYNGSQIGGQYSFNNHYQTSSETNLPHQQHSQMHHQGSYLSNGGTAAGYSEYYDERNLDVPVASKFKKIKMNSMLNGNNGGLAPSSSSQQQAVATTGGQVKKTPGDSNSSNDNCLNEITSNGVSKNGHSHSDEDLNDSNHSYSSISSTFAGGENIFSRCKNFIDIFY